MNFDKIFNQIEEVDPEVFGRMDTRRSAMKEFAGMAGKVAVASIPLMLGSMFKKAYAGASMRGPLDVLNFALTLEYLESNFYNMGSSNSSLIPSADAPGIGLIVSDEAKHVIFLQTAISGAGGTPVAQSSFKYDFTAGGTFNDVFTNYDTFLAVAQAFEDTGVRAYKGQAGYLIGTGAILTAALNIHSVEARHASHIRQIRHLRGAMVKPWITLAQTGINSPAVNASYAGEDNTSIAGMMLVGINGHTEIDANAVSEAFDEILTTDQVVAIAKNFITQGL